jgi:hypothetical protein
LHQGRKRQAVLVGRRGKKSSGREGGGRGAGREGGGGIGQEEGKDLEARRALALSQVAVQVRDLRPPLHDKRTTLREGGREEKGARGERR